MAATKQKVCNNIPDDIILYILSKLPVKSLKRFSIVRKSWANLFENPEFMTLYRNNFISADEDDDNLGLLLKQSFPSMNHDNLFLLSGENRVKLDWPPPLDDDFDYNNIYILGCVVHGILCLYQHRDYPPPPEIELQVLLWNPTTEESKVIPPGSVDCPPGLNLCVELHGFGYDPVTDDYKLIRNYCFYQSDYCWDDDFPKPVWQIYSLRSSSWRNLDVEMPTHALNNKDVYLNGVCHWWGYKRPHVFSKEGQEVLVSFNLSDEVFHTTPLDMNHCYAYADYHRHLAVLKGSIAMITMYADTCFDLSILGELGVKESWTKLFSIGPIPCVEHPMAIYSSEKTMMNWPGLI